MSDSDALTSIDALIAQVDALETSGALSGGRAQALRNHLRNARDQLLAGRQCAALAQLRAFRDQVSSFVADGRFRLTTPSRCSTASARCS